jgi:hypothetical protein
MANGGSSTSVTFIGSCGGASMKNSLVRIVEEP